MSFLYLPMTYFPYPVIRATGFLASYNFSGLFQWYILATFVMCEFSSEFLFLKNYSLKSISSDRSLYH